MVIARSKLMIEDDIVRPRAKIFITYSGPDPRKLYHEIPKILSTVFRVSAQHIQERKYDWSTGDKDKFSVEWEVDKDLDRFSYFLIGIKIKGVSEKGTGNVKIEFDGVLRTEYPQDTVWERSLMYEAMRVFWHSTFYKNKRDDYLREGRRLMALLQEELKLATHKSG